MVRTLLTTLFILTGSAAYAADPVVDCMDDYERAAQPYWRIASDMITFKSMFDDYDRLCTRYYPDDIADLQPAANTLRAQTDADIKNASLVMDRVFDDVLPGDVTQNCAADTAARDTVRKNFLGTLKNQSSRINARLEKSALSLQDPDKTLLLCRDLKKYAPKIEKTLGPGLENPLLEMTAIHSKIVTRDAKARKQALGVWRDTLKTIDQKTIDQKKD